jgi:hypothetical protein
MKVRQFINNMLLQPVVDNANRGGTSTKTRNFERAAWVARDRGAGPVETFQKKRAAMPPSFSTTVHFA